MLALNDKNADRALMADKINKDFESNDEDRADLETKIAAIQEKAEGNFNTHIGAQIKELGTGVTQLIHAVEHADAEAGAAAQEGQAEPQAANKPATYRRPTADRVVDTRVSWWWVTCSDGLPGSLNPAVNTVVEHEDGTITVTPSLDMSKRHPGGWHAWLTKGVFRSC